MSGPRFLACVLAASACSGPGSTSSFGTATQATTLSTGSESYAAESSTSNAETGSESTASSGDSSTDGTSTSGIVWDMGIPDFPRPDPLGCEGRVDFLFVISGEGSMKVFQDRLIASFPGFIEAIKQQLAEFDVHILVTDGDKGWQITDCSVCTTDCDPQGTPPTCGAMLIPCDKGVFGAGVTFPQGTGATNRRCELDSGQRYITTDQEEMDKAFSCIAQIGTGGSGATGQAMVAALQPAINNPDDENACNRGFLREDALLVVTIIMDSFDVDSQGTADEWIEGLRAAKQYDDDAFMVLVLTTDVDIDYNQKCHPDMWSQTKNRLRLLGEGVIHGFVGSICMDSYDDWFKEHVEHLVDLCDDFIPPN